MRTTRIRNRFPHHWRNSGMKVSPDSGQRLQSNGYPPTKQQCHSPCERWSLAESFGRNCAATGPGHPWLSSCQRIDPRFARYFLWHQSECQTVNEEAPPWEANFARNTKDPKPRPFLKALEDAQAYRDEGNQQENHDFQWPDYPDTDRTRVAGLSGHRRTRDDDVHHMQDEDGGKPAM